VSTWRATPSPTSSPAGGRAAATTRWTASAATSATGPGSTRSGWNDPDHPSPERDRRSDAASRHKVSELFGLPVVSRHTQDVSLRAGKAPTSSFEPGYVAAAGSYLYPAVSGFADRRRSRRRCCRPRRPGRRLLHGRIHGVPLRRGPAPDNRPDGAALRAALGASTTDVAASMAVAGSALGTPDEAARRAAERLLAAFSAGLMVQLQQTDTWADIDAFEHTRAFGTLPGGTDGVDRFVDKPAAGSDPGSGFRPGVKVGTKVPVDRVDVEAKVLWSAKQRPAYKVVDSLKHAAGASTAGSTAMAREAAPPAGSAAADAGATVREVPRPAPRWHQPGAPVLAVVGGGRTLSNVEREEAAGELVCRLSDQVDPGHVGVLSGPQLLRSIGTAAVPDEVLALAASRSRRTPT
jgi:hypothetical protein